MIYTIIDKSAGINVVDTEFKPQRISIELNDMTPREALDMGGPPIQDLLAVSANTIFVAADTPGSAEESPRQRHEDVLP